MGLFDKLFKKKEEKTNSVNIPMPQDKDKVSYSWTKDGKMQVEYFEKNAKFDNFYDTTRLMIDPNYKMIDGQTVYDCFVSWFNETDVQMFNPDGIERDSRTAYKNVLAQIDLRLLEVNPEYCKVVMTDLLNQRRVNEYLQRGMQDNPQRPCGNYIGGVRIIQDNKIQKFFDVKVGDDVHYSKEMIDNRKKMKEANERRKQEQIAEKRRQMQKLQDEIDGLSR